MTTLRRLTSCATLILAAILPSTARAQGVDPQASSIISRWSRAMGGPGVWSRVRDLRYTVTTVWYDTASGEETRRRPRYVWLKRTRDGWNVRVERTEAEGRYVQVLNGRDMWATLNGVQLPDSARAVREIEYVAGDLTYWPGLPWKLRDPGVMLEHAPSDREGAGEVVAVSFGEEVGLHPRDRFWWYFGNPVSPFPTEVHYIEQDRSVRQRVRLSGWVTGVPLPHLRSRVYQDDSGRSTRAILYSGFEVNRGISASYFR